ncbi:major capsid protein [uncultured Caudovirales phage]|uniref:Major capsid protein n=1 Tax=uncultured Caudovirales phage TaxID=2100421 RepID=A0A6J7WTR1_9CAUD|nr:major capsid protein [uncultured Caudovirales phage]
MIGFNESLVNKWKAVLEHPDLPKITDAHKRNVTATILENTEIAIREQNAFNPQSLMETSPTNSVGTGGYAGAGGTGVAGYDPILISLVRRAMPNLIAYDVCGVQPMTGPTGLIFAMRANYANSTARTTAEALYNEANTEFSSPGISQANTIGNKSVGTSPASTAQTTVLANSNIYNFAGGANTQQSEALGSTSNVAFAEMAFSIDKQTVTAKSRALKAEYTMELAQDLKAIHGLDAETELANILQSEILAEINREVVRTINITAVRGANTGTTTQGIFDLDTDSNGRWSVEKFKGLMFQIEREANQIAKDTRRGKGNVIICSSDVASALQMAGVLDYTPALNSNNLQVDDTGNTFAGVLNGRFRVYIDPYTTGNYMTVGYKGSNAFDAGLFYCPYVPLQMVRAVGQDSFQPKIGFKTRYGIAPNPFAKGATAASATAAVEEDTNVYYRRVVVSNLL